MQGLGPGLLGVRSPIQLKVEEGIGPPCQLFPHLSTISLQSAMTSSTLGCSTSLTPSSHSCWLTPASVSSMWKWPSLPTGGSCRPKRCVRLFSISLLRVSKRHSCAFPRPSTAVPVPFSRGPHIHRKEISICLWRWGELSLGRGQAAGRETQAPELAPNSRTELLPRRQFPLAGTSARSQPREQ